MAKTITINIHPDGKTDLDITGCSDDSCSKIVDDFKSLGNIVLENKKPEFFAGKSAISNLSKR